MKTSRMRGLFLLAAPPILILLALPAIGHVTRRPDWLNGNRTLTVYVPKSPPASANLVAAANAAIAAWNAANTGWTLTAVTDPTTPKQADVDISEASSVTCAGRSVDGKASYETGKSGGKSYMKHCSIVVKKSLSLARMKAVISHELGHALKLGHCGGTVSVMSDGNPGHHVDPQPCDVAQAKAADKDPPCPLVAADYLLRGKSNQVLYLTPAPGSGISLTGVTGVSVVSETGSDFSATATGWDPEKITLNVNVASTAAHNEVHTTTLTYASHSESYTGVLFIVDAADALNPVQLPHAVAGGDITVTQGTEVVIDGINSYHDVAGTTLSYYWLIEIAGEDDGVGFSTWGGTLSDLPVGVHTAVLYVEDYCGRVSEDSVTITVNAP